MNHHENPGPGAGPRALSNRPFGFAWSVILAAYSLLGLRDGGRIRVWALAAALALALVAAVRPSTLAFANAAWTRTVAVLAAGVNTVVMLAAFFLVVTPAATVLRVCGNDPLRLHAVPAAKTFWLPRAGATFSLTSLRRQF